MASDGNLLLAPEMVPGPPMRSPSRNVVLFPRRRLSFGHSQRFLESSLRGGGARNKRNSMPYLVLLVLAGVMLGCALAFMWTVMRSRGAQDATPDDAETAMQKRSEPMLHLDKSDRQQRPRNTRRRGGDAVLDLDSKRAMYLGGDAREARGAEDNGLSTDDRSNPGASVKTTNRGYGPESTAKHRAGADDGVQRAGGRRSIAKESDRRNSSGVDLSDRRAHTSKLDDNPNEAGARHRFESGENTTLY